MSTDGGGRIHKVVVVQAPPERAMIADKGALFILTRLSVGSMIQCQQLMGAPADIGWRYLNLTSSTDWRVS